MKGRQRSPRDREIQREMTCLREIKDVRDEINMVQSVLRKQYRVLKQLCDHYLEKASPPSLATLGAQLGMLEFSEQWKLFCELHEDKKTSPFDAISAQLLEFSEKWKELDDDAAQVEKSVSRLSYSLPEHSLHIY